MSPPPTNLASPVPRRRKGAKADASRCIIGWREWVDITSLGVSRIKAKVDTGARTSALHAFDINYVQRYGSTWVQFSVHPHQRNTKRVLHCEAPLIDERVVTDSGGRRTLRPVVLATIVLGGLVFDLELTLTARDAMGFRMLLGRQAIRGRFLVDPGQSFRTGRSKRTKPKPRRRRGPRSAERL